MVISDPAHWKEIYGDDKGDKYAKILEMIAAINAGGGMPEPASGKRFLLHTIILGSTPYLLYEVTGTSWALFGGLFPMGISSGWLAALNLPSLTGWTIKYTFRVKAGYEAGTTCYIRLYNRPHNSFVTGSQVTINCGRTSGSFGLYASPGESGYITVGGSDLDTGADDGYQIQAYNNTGGKTVPISDFNLNIYLVKD